MSKTRENKQQHNDHEHDAHTEDVAEQLRTLEAERDEAITARQRALADFANYQKRAADGERRALQSGAANVAKSILPVLDHFDLALEQDSNQVTVEQLFGGVKIVRDELFKSLSNHGVERIDPRPNDEFDPNRHEAMMRVDTQDVEPGRIVSVLQVGYAMADQILRPAKVAIASEASSTEGRWDSME